MIGVGVIGLTVLLLGGEFFTRGAAQIAGLFGLPPILIGLTVVAFGTSAPELAVSLSAAFQGSADLAAANVVGSNIFNVLFVLGLSALIFPLSIDSMIIKREVPLLIFCTLLVYVFSEDGKISQLEGCYLFLGILGYLAWLVAEVRLKRREDRELQREAESEFRGAGSQVFAPGLKNILRASFFLVSGLAMILGGAHFLVESAVKIAQHLGVSEAVIGATIVAVGTSLPEAVTSVVATLKGERDLAIGNVIGSNLFNLMAILGLSASVLPKGLKVAESLMAIDFPVLIVTTLLCAPFFATKMQLSRSEGFFFLSGYVAYTFWLIS